MKTQKYYVVLSLVVLMSTHLAFSQWKPTKPEEIQPTLLGNANPFLAGIDRLYAVILPLDAESNKASALWEKLQTKVEQKLNKAGIKTVSVPVFDSGLRAYDIPELRVYIDMFKAPEHPHYVFRIQTSLARAVCLTEKESLLFKADVWRVAPAMQAVPDETMPATATDVVLEQIEEFIHAYLVANQRPAQPADETERKAPVPPLTQKEPTRSPLRPSVAEYKYVASKNSKVFHNPECQWANKIRPENLVGYNSRDEAIRAGRRPCKTCNP